MANTAPLIGERGLSFATDIVNAGYRTGHNAKLCVMELFTDTEGA